MLRCAVWVAVLGFMLGAGAGCDHGTPAAPEQQGSAPPPIASTKPGACAKGGGSVADAVAAAWFPRTAGDYCIDPNGETRAYGESAPGSLDKVCTEQLDGECEVYKAYGLKRLVTLRYVDGKGSAGSVSVTLSRFASAERAFGFYTKRVVGDSDPKQLEQTLLDAGGAAVMGGSNATVWRGEHVAEITYANEDEAPDQLRESTKRVVPAIAKGIGEKLPGSVSPLAAVAALPRQKLLPFGVVYQPSDALGVAGAGAGAFGYYADGEKRWRVLAALHPDEASASDVMKTLGKLGGAAPQKSMPFPALAFYQKDEPGSPKLEWVVGRKGAQLFGVGDEEAVLGADVPGAEADKRRLSRDEKLARLKALVDAG